MSNLVAEHKAYRMGVAPYRYKGLWSAPNSSLAEHNTHAYNLALKEKPACCHYSCDHCGMAIMNHYIIKDAAGTLFCVGSECIKKVGDVERIEKAEADKKAHNRKLSQARADKKREAERQQREAVLQAERDVNGGLTDWELAEQQRKDALTAQREKNKEAAAYFLNVLYYQNGSFCADIANGLEKGNIPYGRGKTILIEIIAKTAGRKNTAAYKVKYTEAEAELATLEILFNEAA